MDLDNEDDEHRPITAQTINDSYHSVRLLYRRLCEERKGVNKLEAQCKEQVLELQRKLDFAKSLPKEGEGSISSSEITEMKEQLRDIQCTLRKPAALLLEILVGKISVTIPNRDDLLTYKQNYESFKLVNVVIIWMLSVLSLIMDNYTMPAALVHCASVCYYFTITLRELILISNGSRIQPWWLVHHYLSIVIATLLLIWPPGPCYDAFKTQFMLFTCFLTFVMGLQFRYQRGKLYRQIAMGQKHPLSLSKEGEKIKPSKMSILVVCLILIYVFQLYNSVTVMHLYLSSDLQCNHWEMPVVSVLFAVLALGNFTTLSSVIYDKSKKQKTV